ALYDGYRVPPHYDSLIAKLIVHGQSRNECLMRLRRALEEFVVGGVETGIPLHRRIILAPDFINADYDLPSLERSVDTAPSSACAAPPDAGQAPAHSPAAAARLPRRRLPDGRGTRAAGGRLGRPQATRHPAARPVPGAAPAAPHGAPQPLRNPLRYRLRGGSRR